jgi:hypothetical protein
MVATQKAILPFRLQYIALPLAMLLISVIVVAFFYRILPTEIAYRFEDGAPGGWLSRGAIITGTLATQVVLTILAIAIVWVTIRVGARFPVVPTPLVDRLLIIMGNMVALPQIVLAFAMLNIFSYNAYQIQLISPLVFALLVAALGLIALGVLFAVAIRQVNAVRGKS